MPDDRQVGEGAGDVVAELAAMTAGRAHRIFDNRSAFDVGEGLADGGAGDGDTEFDGSADGIGDKLGRLQVGSWAARGSGVKNLHPHTPGPAFTPLHLVPHRITAGSDSCTPDPEEPLIVASTVGWKLHEFNSVRFWKCSDRKRYASILDGPNWPISGGRRRSGFGITPEGKAGVVDVQEGEGGREGASFEMTIYSLDTWLAELVHRAGLHGQR